ncbi:MAG: hypothetical protein ACJ77K_17605 [Bacteroidia bacterium]|jgi:hypothetical protein
MSNFSIISTRIPVSAYVDLKAILDTKNVTISEFLKSAVDETLSEGVYIDVPKDRNKDFLIVLTITTITVFACYRIYKVYKNKIKTKENE